MSCRRDRRAAYHPTDNGANSRSDNTSSDNSRSNDCRSEARHAACHPGSQTIPDGRAVAFHGRRSVSDRGPGEI
jgi:hypothetical protein